MTYLFVEYLEDTTSMSFPGGWR